MDVLFVGLLADAEKAIGYRCGGRTKLRRKPSIVL